MGAVASVGLRLGPGGDGRGLPGDCGRSPLYCGEGEWRR